MNPGYSRRAILKKPAVKLFLRAALSKTPPQTYLDCLNQLDERVQQWDISKVEDVDEFAVLDSYSGPKYSDNFKTLVGFYTLLGISDQIFWGVLNNNALIDAMFDPEDYVKAFRARTELKTTNSDTSCSNDFVTTLDSALSARLQTLTKPKTKQAPPQDNDINAVLTVVVDTHLDPVRNFFTKAFPKANEKNLYQMLDDAAQIYFCTTQATPAINTLLTTSLGRFILAGIEQGEELSQWATNKLTTCTGEQQTKVAEFKTAIQAAFNTDTMVKFRQHMAKNLGGLYGMQDGVEDKEKKNDQKKTPRDRLLHFLSKQPKLLTVINRDASKIQFLADAWAEHTSQKTCELFNPNEAKTEQQPFLIALVLEPQKIDRWFDAMQIDLDTTPRPTPSTATTNGDHDTKLAAELVAYRPCKTKPLPTILPLPEDSKVTHDPETYTTNLSATLQSFRSQTLTRQQKTTARIDLHLFCSRLQLFFTSEANASRLQSFHAAVTQAAQGNAKPLQTFFVANWAVERCLRKNDLQLEVLNAAWHQFPAPALPQDSSPTTVKCFTELNFTFRLHCEKFGYMSSKKTAAQGDSLDPSYRREGKEVPGSITLCRVTHRQRHKDLPPSDSTLFSEAVIIEHTKITPTLDFPLQSPATPFARRNFLLTLPSRPPQNAQHVITTTFCTTPWQSDQENVTQFERELLHILAKIYVKCLTTIKTILDENAGVHTANLRRKYADLCAVLEVQTPTSDAGLLISLRYHFTSRVALALYINHLLKHSVLTQPVADEKSIAPKLRTLQTQLDLDNKIIQEILVLPRPGW